MTQFYSAYTIKLLDSVSSATTSSVVEVHPNGPADANGVYQAIISDTATVELQGSLDNSNWYTIASTSSSTGAQVHIPRYIRAEVTSYSSGNVTLLIALPGNWESDTQ